MTATIFALDHLTAIETDPAGLIETADRSGFRRACSFVRSIEGLGGPDFNLSRYPEQLRAATSAMAAHGVTLDIAYPFSLSGRSVTSDFLPDLEVAAALRAPLVNLLVYLRDESEILDKASDFCAAAATVGLGVAIELAPVTSLKTLGQTAGLVRALARTGQVGVNLDVLHLYRSGGTPSDIAPYRADVLYAQLCDGALARPADEWRDEGALQRDRPGEGEMDLRNFLDALSGVPISVEVPDQRRRLAGESAMDRASHTRLAAEKLSIL